MISQTGTGYVDLQALRFCCHSWISEPSVAWYLQVSCGIWPQKRPRKNNSHQPCHQHHPVAIPTPPIPETKNCKKIIDSPAAYMAWKFQFHFYSEWSTRRHTVVKDLPGEGPQAKRSQKNNSKFSPSFGGNGKRSFPFGERAHFQGASSLVSGLFVHSCWTCECLFFDKV